MLKLFPLPRSRACPSVSVADHHPVVADAEAASSPVTMAHWPDRLNASGNVEMRMVELDTYRTSSRTSHRRPGTVCVLGRAALALAAAFASRAPATRR